jgi:hypothetical protein
MGNPPMFHLRTVILNSLGILSMLLSSLPARAQSSVPHPTSTQGAVYATQAIRNQIAIDSNFSANSGISPTWIFVNARPSRPLVNLMQQNRIPWHQLKVPWE